MQNDMRNICAAILCSVSLQLLHGAPTPPQNSAWRIIHVIPVVNQLEESRDARGNLTIKDSWYVLLGKNANRGEGYIPNNSQWDVLTASQAEMQPTTIFGFATIKSLPWQRTKQFFMKTVYNTLELLTGGSRLFGKKGLYTRSDYAYYYQDEPIPPFFVDVKKAELYVFLNLSNKKNSTFLEDEDRWVSQWKTQFTWVSVDRLVALANGRQLYLSEKGDDYYVNDETRDLFRTKNEKGNVISQWQTALTELQEYEKNTAVKSKKPIIEKRKQDIERDLARQAKDSWLLFANALYFNEDTKTYKVFALKDETYPIDFGTGQSYVSLEEYRNQLVYANREISRKGNAAELDLDAVYEGLEKRLQNYEEFKNLLLSTADRVLIYGNKKDSLFGIGSTGHGENNLGRMLMVLRANLRGTKMNFDTKTSYPLDVLRVQFNQVNQAQGMLRYLRFRATGGLPAMTAFKPGTVARQSQARDETIKKILEVDVNQPEPLGRVTPSKMSAPIIQEQSQQPVELITPTGKKSGIRRRLIKPRKEEVVERKKEELLEQVNKPKNQ